MRCCMEEVQAEAAQVPCVEHRVSPAQAAICCTLAGASKRVVCSHQDKVGTWSSFQAWELVAPDTLCHCVVWSNRGGPVDYCSQNPVEVGCGGCPL